MAKSDCSIVNRPDHAALCPTVHLYEYCSVVWFQKECRFASIRTGSAKRSSASVRSMPSKGNGVRSICTSLVAVAHRQSSSSFSFDYADTSSDRHSVMYTLLSPLFRFDADREKSVWVAVEKNGISFFLSKIKHHVAFPRFLFPSPTFCGACLFCLFSVFSRFGFNRPLPSSTVKKSQRMCSHIILATESSSTPKNYREINLRACEFTGVRTHVLSVGFEVPTEPTC